MDLLRLSVAHSLTQTSTQIQHFSVIREEPSCPVWCTNQRPQRQDPGETQVFRGYVSIWLLHFLNLDNKDVVESWQDQHNKQGFIWTRMWDFPYWEWHLYDNIEHLLCHHKINVVQYLMLSILSLFVSPLKFLKIACVSIMRAFKNRHSKHVT